MAVSDETPRLGTYAELADQLANLRLLLQSMRRARRMTLREVAAEIGCSFSTVHRIEKGDECTLANAVMVLRWLDQAALTTAPYPPVVGHA